jgi:hypothetical protein
MFEELLALLPTGNRGANLLLLAGALPVGLLAARRAHARGISPEPLWNQLLLGLLIGIPLAYGALMAQSDMEGAGQGGLIAIMLALMLAIWWRELPLLRWLDIGAAPVLLGLALGRLGGALGQDGPLSAVLFFVPLWLLAALGALLWIERAFGPRLRPGDSALLCGLLASASSVVALGLAIAAAGAAAVQQADLLRVAMFLGCGALLVWRRQGDDERGEGGTERGRLLRSRE